MYVETNRSIKKYIYNFLKSPTRTPGHCSINKICQACLIIALNYPLDPNMHINKALHAQ